ncbi:MAG: ABC-2 family transporter protein [Candidatus Handelsmanbacteria bacterium]|nr:ABC-2 family transporter protein [Candidatus Handelsmanbacteria bacterium]
MGAEWFARLLRLWGVYSRMEFMWMTRDLRFFCHCFFCDAIVNLAAVSGTFLLAERFAGLGMWSKPQVVFLLGYGMLVGGLINTLFGCNVLYVSRRLGRGQLDHTLIQPQPLWLSLLTEGFMPISGSAILLPAAGLLWWAGAELGLDPGAGWWALFAMEILASATIATAFSYLWGSLAFWAPRAAEEISSSALRIVYQLTPFPLDGSGPLLIGGLLSVLPIGFVAWYPCRFLLGLSPSPCDGALTPLAALFFALAAGLTFAKGKKHYARTGSSRYLSFGHRS